MKSPIASTGRRTIAEYIWRRRFKRAYRKHGVTDEREWSYIPRYARMADEARTLFRRRVRA